jgi:ADP-ribose pyrophosphatase
MLFVRQFRKPVDCHCLEIVAGLIEPGETPEDCAVRELSEETGYVANSIEELGDVMLTPGYSDERIHLFFAEVDGSRREQSLDPDEHVELVAIDAQDINRQVAEGIITDGKTLAALLLYRIKLQ